MADIPSHLETANVTTGPLPASRKIHVAGRLHPGIRVPLREIALEPSAKEPPVRVYDTTGPYTDPNARIDAMTDYAARNVLPEIQRLPGIGQAQLFLQRLQFLLA